MALRDVANIAVMNKIAVDLGIVRRGKWGAQSPKGPLEPD